MKMVSRNLNRNSLFYFITHVSDYQMKMSRVCFFPHMTLISTALIFLKNDPNLSFVQKKLVNSLD